MDLTQLRMFCCVAETGSLARAAEQLHRVPSNLTTRLRQLELELAQNAWLTVAARPEILFTMPPEDRLPAAAEVFRAAQAPARGQRPRHRGDTCQTIAVGVGMAHVFDTGIDQAVERDALGAGHAAGECARGGYQRKTVRAQGGGLHVGAPPRVEPVPPPMCGGPAVWNAWKAPSGPGTAPAARTKKETRALAGPG